MNHPLNEMMTSSMAKIKDMIDVNTVIGDPITTPDGVTLIPITKVSVGYGGGAGAGVTITPMAFVVIRGESVRMIPIAEPASTSVDRIVEMVPDILDRVEALLRKPQDKNSADA